MTKNSSRAYTVHYTHVANDAHGVFTRLTETDALAKVAELKARADLASVCYVYSGSSRRGH